MQVITVNVTSGQITSMESMIALGVFASRSEIIRGAMHDFLTAELVDMPKEEEEVIPACK